MPAAAGANANHKAPGGGGEEDEEPNKKKRFGCKKNKQCWSAAEMRGSVCALPFSSRAHTCPHIKLQHRRWGRCVNNTGRELFFFLQLDAGLSDDITIAKEENKKQHWHKNMKKKVLPANKLLNIFRTGGQYTSGMFNSLHYPHIHIKVQRCCSCSQLMLQSCPTSKVQFLIAGLRLLEAKSTLRAPESLLFFFPPFERKNKGQMEVVAD